ncbi:MAG: hypothetical protein OWV35_11165, partial [Firmicutes bacterium]|nr:hypothetical protein [Bacillota bacterium]
MATRDAYRQLQATTAALRQIPLATVIPLAFPGATGPTPGQGPDVVQWRLPDGSKVNVKMTNQSDLYRVWSGPYAGRAGTGAINFLVDLGVCADFAQAKAWLQQAVPTATREAPAAKPVTATPERPFQLPPSQRDPRAAWAMIQDYLVEIRKLPAPLVRQLVMADPPAVLAGWGPRYGHYLLFPCWDHAQPLAGQRPTGALLRWRHSDREPPRDWFGGNPRPMAPGSSKRAGWWQIGAPTAPTLIITEAPIDGLSVAASLTPVTDIHPRLPADVAILALGGEAGFTPRQLQGHRQVLCATDRDEAG